MKYNILLSSLISLQFAANPSCVLAHGGGGGGGGAPHMGGGAPAAPRMSAPQMPRMSAMPRMEAPRMPAPQMPRMEARMAAPQMSRMSAMPRMEGSRAPGTQLSRMESPQRLQGSRMENARPNAHTMQSAQRFEPSRSMTPGSTRSSRSNVEQATRFASVAPQKRVQSYEKMTPTQRNVAMTRLNPEQRAETIGRMKPEQRAGAMYKMNPSQRAETLAKMSPQTRNSFLSKNERITGGQKLAMGGAAMVGAGIAAHQMMQPRATVEQRAARGAEFNVPRAPGYANPRNVSRAQLETKPMISKQLGQPLKWRAGATVPRAGARGVGVGGVLDPGGYTRHAAMAPGMVTPSFAMRQFGQHFPTYAAQVAFNHQHLIANRANWPWHLPNYAPGWFGGNQGAWNWNQNWWQQPWQNWRNQQLALNALNAQNAWWNNIAYNNANNWWNWNNGGLWNLSPWGLNSGMSWLPGLNYYDGYGYDGVNYPIDYFADQGYVPTPYVFDVAAGQFWQPGVGYSDYLPQGYNAPMTVAVQESVPSYDPQGEIVGYQLQNFYYNAFWVPQAESYGYYDYRQQFHWVTFPWMNNW